jgi:hypothetical protein
MLLCLQEGLGFIAAAARTGLWSGAVLRNRMTGPTQMGKFEIETRSESHGAEASDAVWGIQSTGAT